MKNTKIYSAIFTVLCSIFTFCSCSDESNQPLNPTGKITVSGKVTNLVNQAAPNIKVKISGADSVITSNEGSFSVTNVTVPYNLLVADVFENSVVYYYGVTVDQVRIPDIGLINDSVHCEISVTYPPEIFKPGVDGKVMFTDGNYLNAYGQFSQGSPFWVWLLDNSPVSGRLILITYKKDASGKIISYENFGESAPIQVSNGGKYTYNFSTDEVSFNPGEEVLNGSINLQPGYDTEYKLFYLTFSDKRTSSYSFLIMFETITGNTFNIVVPSDLSLQFSSMLSCNTYKGQLYNMELFKLPTGSSGIILDTKPPPELITPEDNAIDVNVNTEFTFTDGTSTGIYIVNLYNQTEDKRYSVYTSSNHFRLSEFSEIFPKGISGSVFRWSVVKFGFSSSVNEYLTSFTFRPEAFQTNSIERGFTTAK